MYYIIYSSQVAEDMTDQNLLDIMDKANVRNKELNLTGILIQVKDRFIQLLEGDKKDVEAVFSSIDADARHHNINMLLTGYYQDRLFSDWSMAFTRSSGDEFKEVTGYQDVNQVEELNEFNNESHPALIFIRHFTNQVIKHYKHELAMAQ